MRIAVMGATGPIGKRITDQLSMAGEKVRALSRAAVLAHYFEPG